MNSTEIMRANNLIRDINDSKVIEDIKYSLRNHLCLTDNEDIELLMYIEELEQRISIAIEYIYSGKTFDTIDAEKVINKIQNDLLNILKGVDNE